MPTHVAGQADASNHPAPSEPVYPIIPSDDAGMSPCVNTGPETHMLDLRANGALDVTSRRIRTQVLYSEEY